VLLTISQLQKIPSESEYKRSNKKSLANTDYKYTEEREEHEADKVKKESNSNNYFT
jgi:hypothetical protein